MDRESLLEMVTTGLGTERAGHCVPYNLCAFTALTETLAIGRLMQRSLPFVQYHAHNRASEKCNNLQFDDSKMRNAQWVAQKRAVVVILNHRESRWCTSANNRSGLLNFKLSFKLRIQQSELRANTGTGSERSTLKGWIVAVCLTKLWLVSLSAFH